MKPIHLLAGLLATLIILLDLVVVTGFRSSYDAPLMFYAGLVFGQLALLAFWCVLARGNRVARVMATLAAAACLSHPLGEATGISWHQWFTLLCLFAACTGGTLLAGRFIGTRPRLTDAASAAQSSRRSGPLTQFSLTSLLSLMTVVALALGLRGHIDFPREESLAIASYGLWLTLVAMAAFWALASRHALVTRLIVLAVLCLAAGWFMARTEHYQSTWYFTNIAMIEAVVICAGVAVAQTGIRCAQADG